MGAIAFGALRNPELGHQGRGARPGELGHPAKKCAGRVGEELSHLPSPSVAANPFGSVNGRPADGGGGSSATSPRGITQPRMDGHKHNDHQHQPAAGGDHSPSVHPFGSSAAAAAGTTTGAVLIEGERQIIGGVVRGGGGRDRKQSRCSSLHFAVKKGERKNFLAIEDTVKVMEALKVDSISNVTLMLYAFRQEEDV